MSGVVFYAMEAGVVVRYFRRRRVTVVVIKQGFLPPFRSYNILCVGATGNMEYACWLLVLVIMGFVISPMMVAFELFPFEFDFSSFQAKKLTV